MTAAQRILFISVNTIVPLRLQKSLHAMNGFSDVNVPPSSTQVLCNLLWDGKFKPESTPMLRLDEIFVSNSPLINPHEINIKVTCENTTFRLGVMND